jgi:shikimate kinase
VAARAVFLVGFSGTGKSTVARLAAARLGLPAVDLDRAIAERAGCAIPEIFARDGEAAFRELEAEALRAAATAGPAVVATGGGAPVRPENRRIMAEAGWVVSLEARPETLGARIRRQLGQAADDAVRPLLGEGDPLARIRALKHARQSVYALADWTVHTDRLTPEQVAGEVVRAVRLLEGAPAAEAGFDVPAPGCPDGGPPPRG